MGVCFYYCLGWARYWGGGGFYLDVFLCYKYTYIIVHIFFAHLAKILKTSLPQ